MNARRILCIALALPALFALSSIARAQPTNAPAKPAESSSASADAEDLNNWVELGVGGSVVSGDRARLVLFDERVGQPA